jgi:hypothetical protein
MRDGTDLDIPAIAVPPLLPGLLRTRIVMRDPAAHLPLGSRAETRARAKTIALERPCEWNSPSCTTGRRTRLREHNNRAPKLPVRSRATVRHAPTVRLRVSGTMMLLRDVAADPARLRTATAAASDADSNLKDFPQPLTTQAVIVSGLFFS